MAEATLAETIKFCADNQVVMEVTYNGQVRTVEVYSFRTSGNGESLLYVHEYNDGKTKSYKVDRIEHAKATKIKFTPRYTIEI